jgi:hypothetical protein
MLTQPTHSSHEWYQNDNFVIISIFIKNLKKEHIEVQFTEKSVSLNLCVLLVCELKDGWLAVLHNKAPYWQRVLFGVGSVVR